MTNESDHVNTMFCRGCGECCRHFDIFYPKGRAGNKKNQLLLSEMERFKRLAWMGDMVEQTEVDGGYRLRFNIPCKHLLMDENELLRCEIYDSPDRPLLCRQFPYKNTTLDECPHKDRFEQMEESE
jgi:Fe-S-cluster containining protein